MNNKSSSLISTLPLEWTRINRGSKRRKITTATTNAGDEIDFFCCEDPACEETKSTPTTTTTSTSTSDKNQHHDSSKTTQIKNQQQSQLTKVPMPNKSKSTSNIKEKKGDNDDNDDNDDGNKNKNKSTTKMVTLKGKGLFCLHTLDCKWFQGHFIPSSSFSINSSSFGLLAIERNDIDDCLQCNDGGYREINLNILSASKKKAKTKTLNNDDDDDDDTGIVNKKRKRRKLKVDRLQCTGGDMLRITTPIDIGSDIGIDIQTTNAIHAKMIEEKVQVNFDADRVITGIKVESLVGKYFSNLVPSLNMNDKTGTKSVLNLLPDCAIVTGDMSLKVPSEFVYGRETKNNEIDDWLE